MDIARSNELSAQWSLGPSLEEMAGTLIYEAASNGDRFWNLFSVFCSARE